ncbi:MAG: GAF domain-containing protein [Cytophagaceae bacterium]|nr:MAG: GAF domain-containing protein [Cytophagaceae bacterium]
MKKLLKHLKMPKQFVVITPDMSPIMVSNIRGLLSDARNLLEMDIVFVSEIFEGQRLIRWVDKAADADQSIMEGQFNALEETYCQRVVDSRLPLAIPDAQLLPEAEKLDATKALGLRTYLAVPIVLSDGEVFGTLCCISHKPRTALGNRQIDALRLIAERVVMEIQKNLRISQ